MGKTVIVGSVPKPHKYAYQAAERLSENDIDFVPLGIQEGEVLGKQILNIYNEPVIDDVDTITMYVGAARQEGISDYLLSLKPKRIIFNPGAENQLFKAKAEAQGIACLEACTLVMLSIGNY